MTAQHTDSYALSINGTFINRVQTALVSAAVSISNESSTVTGHASRRSYSAIVLGMQFASAQAFALAVACDTTCLSDATGAGTIIVTSTNSDARQAAVPDTHIDNALAAAFNAFIQGFST